MKKTLMSVAVVAMIGISITGCLKEGDAPVISFKKTAGYTSADATIETGTEVTFGIKAKSAAKDPIVIFSITENVNNGVPTTIFTDSVEASSFTHDHTFNLEGAAGEAHEYTFFAITQDSIVGTENLVITVAE